MSPKRVKVLPVPQNFTDPELEAQVLAALAEAGADRFFELSGVLSHRLFTAHRDDYLALSRAFYLGKPLPPVPDANVPPGFDLEGAIKRLADLAGRRTLAEALLKAKADLGRKPAGEVIAELRWALEEVSGQGPKIYCLSDPDLVNETLGMAQNGISARKALSRYISLVPGAIAAELDGKELALPVFAALCYLWDRQGRPENGVVRTTRAELCRMLDMRKLRSVPPWIDEALTMLCRTFIDWQGPAAGAENGQPVEMHSPRFRVLAAVSATVVRDGEDVPAWEQELEICINPLVFWMLENASTGNQERGKPVR